MPTGYIVDHQFMVPFPVGRIPPRNATWWCQCCHSIASNNSPLIQPLTTWARYQPSMLRCVSTWTIARPPVTVAAIAALVLGSWRMLQLASVRYCLSHYVTLRVTSAVMVNVPLSGVVTVPLLSTCTS